MVKCEKRDDIFGPECNCRESLGRCFGRGVCSVYLEQVGRKIDEIIEEVRE